MDSKLLEILDEWEEGMFMFPELLAEAYTTFLGQLVGSSAVERRDPRVIPFLLAGYTAYVEDQKGQDPHAALTYRMALAMAGCGSNAPTRPATPPARPAPSPQPGPSRARSPSPEPGPSKPRSPETAKRPREAEDQEEEEEGPTLEVLQTRERVLKRFNNTRFREETIQIKGLTSALPSEQLLVNMFDTILQRQREATQAKDDDRVILEIQPSEGTQNPLWFSMRRADQINGQVIMDKLSRVLNSNQNFTSAEGKLTEMIKRRLKPDLILQGGKIISMKVGNWKFLDSLCFMPMPLAAMPKSFDFQELKKGFFPYLAGPEFYNYEGPLLDRELYCVSGMKRKAAEEFDRWYDEQVSNNYLFNYKKELVDYCISDVTILRHACQAFRKLFKHHAGFDPMVHCVTLSSACMNAFRRNFLQKDTIGIVPPAGYHGMGKQSEIALKWLDYESHKLNTVIKTIYTDREVSIMGRRVDGYVEIPKRDGTVEKRIYQFHGDYWHQCPLHFPPASGCGENRLEQTKRITEIFREAGYKVIEKWECQFKADLMNDPDTKAYFSAHPTTRVPPLNLGDPLAGGRTSALRWYHKADIEMGEKIKMVDVVSEYPGCNLRGKYPISHPHIFREGDQNIPPVEQWNGLVKCTVLPPRDLFLPVLWVKAHGKLLFPLCRTCVETQNTEVCRHDDPTLRQLTGSWCSPELQLAILEKGYKLQAVHEVLQYPDTMQFDPETGRDGLLSAYVRCFMALKIEASGWPTHCQSDEQKREFVADILKHDGIVINPDNMARKPALRVLSKLILNSFWGKFGERTLRPKAELIYDYTDLLRLVTDPTKKVTALIPLRDDCLQVNSMPVEDSEVSLPTSSLVHAAFTTCFGRIQLYRYLDLVGKRALYHDTDSVAYISRPGQDDLPLGTHLGDLTDQIEEDWGPGSFITEMVCGGPKNYAMKIAKGGDLNDIQVSIKVRGISINKSCDDLVTFENLKAMVLGERTNVLVPIPRQIARLQTWKIVTRRTSKNWKAQNTKRRRVGVELTVPIGYNAWGADEDEEMCGRMEELDNS
ncbi:putative DNA polymerase [Frankliniella fusca]|uniref:DNA-directed DNA polymerase n=1 Tax=Frankliniella fusca TaxID=407009 RepID=A0AAE1GT76_9NEOP|nr:putative DNA polymerase [Frankliniella fusca]